MLRARPVHVLLTDYDMPAINGLFLIGWAKRRGLAAQCILHSAVGDQFRHAFDSDRIGVCLLKPASSALVVSTLDLAVATALADAAPEAASLSLDSRKGCVRRDA